MQVFLFGWLLRFRLELARRSATELMAKAEFEGKYESLIFSRDIQLQTVTYQKDRLSGALFIVAVVQFVLCLIIAESLYKGYSVSANYVSDLGVGSSSIVFNSSVFVLGLLVGIGAYFLRSLPKLKTVKILLFLMALGAMGVGVFTKDFTVAHGAVSSAAFFFGGLSAILSGFFLKKPLSWISVVLGSMTIVALALFSIGIVTSGSMSSTFAYDSIFYLGLGPGGMERMIIYPAIMWLALFGSRLTTNQEE
jgi:hypothetical membrane protein